MLIEEIENSSDNPLHENSIIRLYDHFVKERNGNPISFAKRDKIGLVLELLGGSAGIYAGPPAWLYAKDMADWLKYCFAITNPMSNVLFLMKATDGLIDTIQKEASIPAEIEDLIEKQSKAELASKYLKLSLGSIICVIPFGISAYMFPLPGCDELPCLSTIVLHSTLSNTIMHAVAWGLILTPEFWYYRLPTLPLEKFYHALLNCLTSPTERRLTELRKEQETLFNLYKQKVSGAMVQATEQLVRDYLNKVPGSSDNLRRLSHMSLGDFLKFAQQEMTENPEVSNVRLFLSKIYHLLDNGPVKLLGALIMVFGCMGWIANPYYIALKEGLNLPESIAVGTLPAYSTGVLCAFYGTAVFSQIFHYLTNWPSFAEKFSFEARMFPFAFTMWTMINLFVSFFAYATAEQLINTIFSDPLWDNIRPTFNQIALPTLQLLSFIPLTELFNLVTRKTVAKFGSVESAQTLAMRLLLKASDLEHYIRHMKGQALMDAVAELPFEGKQALGIESHKFDEDYVLFMQGKESEANMEGHLKAQSNTKWYQSVGNKLLFWKSQPSSSTAPLLNESIRPRSSV